MMKFVCLAMLLVVVTALPADESKLAPSAPVNSEVNPEASVQAADLKEGDEGLSPAESGWYGGWSSPYYGGWGGRSYYGGGWGGYGGWGRGYGGWGRGYGGYGGGWGRRYYGGWW